MKLCLCVGMIGFSPEENKALCKSIPMSVRETRTLSVRKMEFVPSFMRRETWDKITLPELNEMMEYLMSPILVNTTYTQVTDLQIFCATQRRHNASAQTEIIQFCNAHECYHKKYIITLDDFNRIFWLLTCPVIIWPVHLADKTIAYELSDIYGKQILYMCKEDNDGHIINNSACAISASWESSLINIDVLVTLEYAKTFDFYDYV